MVDAAAVCQEVVVDHERNGHGAVLDQLNLHERLVAGAVEAADVVIPGRVRARTRRLCAALAVLALVRIARLLEFNRCVRVNRSNNSLINITM